LRPRFEEFSGKRPAPPRKENPHQKGDHDVGRGTKKRGSKTSEKQNRGATIHRTRRQTSFRKKKT